MSWARILAPLSGAPEDKAVLKASETYAARFKCELACAYTPVDPADLMPWTSDGYLGGAQVAALDSLRDAAAEGERIARSRFDTLAWADRAFVTLESPVAPSLCVEARLADLVVFGSNAARGASPLAEAFQQVLIEERRPILVAREEIGAPGVIAIAWDGGREATNAARAAMPLIRQASRIVILAAPQATPRDYDPARLADYLARCGSAVDVQVIGETGEAAPLLVAAAKALSADLLVAGSFGHPRFQRFIFGGVTKGLLQSSDGPPLFLAH